MLGELLSKLPLARAYPDLLVGTESSDDAAVYRINAEQAMLGTVESMLRPAVVLDILQHFTVFAGLIANGKQDQVGSSWNAHSAFAQGGPALTGKVSSAAEGAMEGVVVSLKKGILTTSVTSNAKGECVVPAGRLTPGDYTVSVRAVGYVLDGPKTLSIAADKAATLDVKLNKTRNLASQLTNLEWIISAPGTDEQRKALSGCTNCHSVERIMNSAYDADEFFEVIKRMAQYSNNSFYKKPQIRAEVRDINRFVPNAEKVAAYFASVNARLTIFLNFDNG